MKVSSMTGYGRGEYMSAERKFTVEMKSVNHRYNEISIKSPRALASLEDKIKKKIMQQVFRGKTDVYISFETFSDADTEIKLNENLATAYLEKLNQLEQRFSLHSETDKLEMVAKFPEVLTVEKTPQEESVIWAVLFPALEMALEKFVAMRNTEGEILKKDILQKRECICTLLEKVEKRAPFVVLEYQEKLKNRIQELLDTVDIEPQRIATEIAIFADRCCIDEEITRLKSHLMQLKAILEDGGQVGRKLDFLIQEMNREVNTIASKANDMQIVQSTITLKSEIEKIREQIQNLE